MALNLKPGTPKCERCGIPTCTKAKIKCDACEAHDQEVAEKLAAGWAEDDE